MNYLEVLVIEAMTEMRHKASAQQIQSRYGIPAYNEAVRRVQSQSDGHMSVQQFFAKQEAEKREFFRNQVSQGTKTQQVSQQEHNHIVDRILQSVNDGTKPAVRPLLEAYSKELSRAPEWASRVATQTHPKKMGKTLNANKDHPVIQDLKDGHLFSQTHKGAIQRSTYSGFADILFTASQIVRNQKRMQRQIDEMAVRLSIAEAHAIRANVRLDDNDQWKVKAVEMHSAGASYSVIAEKVGKGKSTVNDYIRGLALAARSNISGIASSHL